ncbi:MAG: phosphatase PAP2 family protein, partial [Terracidiphilus sp.]|nr:phosphatase PAP2 family protein [Terracidiphilus sp.]
RAIDILINPSTIAIIALLLSVIWMLRDEKDRARIELVFALVLNLFYGVFLNIFMGREGAAFPWKFDHVLFRLDASLGIQAACIARPLQGFLHIPLWLVYQSMVPMMIAWFLLTRYRRSPGSIILAYVAELVSGPLLYMIVPACGPIYAFGKQWLSPPAVAPEAVRLAGMPNAFPSLHIGTALVFLMFAPGKIWKAVALLFLAATCLATLSTGEHYVIDLIPGLAFGVFVSAIGMRNLRRAGCFLALTLSWSLGVRFAYTILLAHPMLTRSLAGLTVMAAAFALARQWSTAPALEAGHGIPA